MLSNAYFLAKFRIDTAENEPAKNLHNLLYIKKKLQTSRSAPPASAPPTSAPPEDGDPEESPAMSSSSAGDRDAANFRQYFVRFRLYRRRSMQVNMRFTAFFKIYQIISDYLAAIYEFSHHFVNFATFAEMYKCC